MKNKLSNLTIRDAQDKDALLLAQAQREIAKVPGRLASRPHEIKDKAFQKLIAELSTSQTGKFIVVEVDGQLAGHAWLEPMHLETTSHLVDLTLAVHEGSQGQGLGEVLLSHLIGWAKENVKIEKILLNVRSTNLPAIHLYKKLGFVVEGVRAKQIKIGPDSYLDDLAMGLRVCN